MISFVDLVKSECEKHNVRFKLSQVTVMPCNNDSTLLVNGYFSEGRDGEPGELAVSCGVDEDEWMLTLAHEYQHMQQWIDKSPYFEAMTVAGSIDTTDLIDLWTNNHIELNDEQRQHAIMSSLMCELDCERRTLEYIKNSSYFKHIDPKEYAQKANAYVLFYHLIGKYRRWYSEGKEPYRIPAIIMKMPTDLHTLDYAEFPSWAETLYVEHALAE